MKKLLLILSFAFLLKSSFSQCNGRYENEIFSSVTKTTVNYSDVYINSHHQMDIYTPDGDIEINRPLILFMHGGSFYGGNKTDTDCWSSCRSVGHHCCPLGARLSS